MTGTPPSPDDRDFEKIYWNIPVGVTVVAAKLDHSETLRSFCYSLKGAAIRLGSNAMFFFWHYSKRNWPDRGVRHLRNFVEKHKGNGVRLFLMDESAQAPSYVDREVAQLIREIVEPAGVSVILAVTASSPAEGDERPVAVLQGGTIECMPPSAIALHGHSITRDLGGEFAAGTASGQGLIVRVTHLTTELVRDAYFATTCFRGQVEEYGPLSFLEKCPQPPDSGADRTARV